MGRTKEIFNTQTGYFEDVTFEEFAALEWERGNSRENSEYVWDRLDTVEISVDIS